VRLCLRDNRKDQKTGEFSRILERAKEDYPEQYSQLLGLPDGFEDIEGFEIEAIPTEEAHIIPFNLGNFFKQKR